MSSFKRAAVALKNQNSDEFCKVVDKLKKSEIEELAAMLNIQSGILQMQGSWIEQFKADLVNSDSEVIQAAITCERGYKGLLEQMYGPGSLHFLAVTCIDVNFSNDYDEDNFEPGTMLFDLFDAPADSADYSFESNYESRSIRTNEIEDEDFDESEYDIEELNFPIELTQAFIVPKNIKLALVGGKSITFNVSDPSPELCWFLFSSLFMSSGKSISELTTRHFEIKDFMNQNFDILVN
jgi:hypothetical protein